MGDRRAQHTTSMIAHPVSITQVLALEGKAKVPRLVPPTVEQIKSFEPGEFVNRYRIRIDPLKAKDTDSMIRFEFTDADNTAVALHIRRGVVEYVEDPDHYYRKPDFTLALTREVWTKRKGAGHEGEVTIFWVWMSMPRRSP